MTQVKGVKGAQCSTSDRCVFGLHGVWHVHLLGVITAMHYACYDPCYTTTLREESRLPTRLLGYSVAAALTRLVCVVDTRCWR